MWRCDSTGRANCAGAHQTDGLFLRRTPGGGGVGQRRSNVGRRGAGDRTSMPERRQRALGLARDAATPSRRGPIRRRPRAGGYLPRAEARALTETVTPRPNRGLRTALGAGAPGKGHAERCGAATGGYQNLNRTAESPALRKASRDALDRALIDPGDLFREPCLVSAIPGERSRPC